MAEYCPDCGETVEPNDRFCYYCGEQLAPGKPDNSPEIRSCPDCGEYAYPEDNYCYYCGELLPAVDSQSAERAETPQRRESAPNASDRAGSETGSKRGRPPTESADSEPPTARHYSADQSSTDSADPFQPEQQCPECGKSMESEATFCYYCGTQFE